MYRGCLRTSPFFCPFILKIKRMFSHQKTKIRSKFKWV
nr:MAG TPA: complex 1 protein [Caudoviricetes sp.]